MDEPDSQWQEASLATAKKVTALHCLLGALVVDEEKRKRKNGKEKERRNLKWNSHQR